MPIDNPNRDITISYENPVLNGEVAEGTITITLKPNTSGANRRCRLVFSYQYENDDETLSQEYYWDNYGNLFIGQSAN